MRHLLFLLLVTLSLLPSVAPAAEAAPPPTPAASPSPGDAIIGRWKADEGGLVATISAVDGKYAGVVSESPQKPALVGKPMFRGLIYDAAASTWKGEVYAPKRDEFVPATIQLSKEGFTLKGGKGLMSKTMKWTRG